MRRYLNMENARQSFGEFARRVRAGRVFLIGTGFNARGYPIIVVRRCPTPRPST